MTDDDLKKITDLLYDRFEASEKRILDGVDKRFEASDKKIASMESRLTEEFSASEQRIVRAIGDFISQNVLPLIDEKADKSDIDRLERKMDRVLDKDLEQDRRLDRIESVSVVAQKLRLQKSNNSSDE